MATQKLKGQEVTIVITRGGALEDELTDIHNFECSLEMENPTMGYLGQTHDDVDELFKRCSGTMELHMHTSAVARFEKAVLDRATRKTPDLVIGIGATLTMPDGTNVTKAFPDARFGTMVMTAGSRADFVNFKIPWFHGEPPTFQFDQ